MKIQDKQTSINQFNEILKSPNAWRLGVFNGDRHSDKNFVAKWEGSESEHSTILDTLNGINTMIATIDENLSRSVITNLVQSVGGQDTYLGAFHFGNVALLQTWLLKLNLIDNHKLLEIPQDKKLKALQDAYAAKFAAFIAMPDNNIWNIYYKNQGSDYTLLNFYNEAKNQVWFNTYKDSFEEYTNTFQVFKTVTQDFKQFSQDTAEVLMQTDSIKSQNLSLKDIYSVSSPHAFSLLLNNLKISGVSNRDQISNKVIVNGLIEIYNNKILLNELPQNYDEQKDDTLNTLIDLICALERLHPLPDYNCRTFCYLTLNRELMKNGFAPVVFEDPNDFDWMSREQLKTEILKGQQNFQNLVAIGKLHDQDPSIDELSVESKNILNTIMSKYDCDWQTLSTNTTKTEFIGQEFIGQDMNQDMFLS